jgi:hypothetical protein
MIELEVLNAVMGFGQTITLCSSTAELFHELVSRFVLFMNSRAGASRDRTVFLYQWE